MKRNKNYYTVTGSFDFASRINKRFPNENSAIEYALKMFPGNSEIKEEIFKSNNSTEYVISQTRRFTITEIMA